MTVLQAYRRLLPYIVHQWPALILAGGLSLLGAALTALQPLPLKLLVDHALGTTPLPAPLDSALTSVPPDRVPLVLIAGAAISSLGVFGLSSLLETAFYR